MNVIRTALAMAILGTLLVPGAESQAGKKNYLDPKWNDQTVESIGVLPWAFRQFDENAAKIMRSRLEEALRPLPYRFQGEVTFRTNARNAGADSLLDALKSQWHKKESLDPKTLKKLGQAVHVDAVLAAYLLDWERETISPNQSGSSWTKIGTRYALFSTATGKRLWSSEITEEGYGPYNDPSGQGVVAIDKSGIQTQVTTSTQLDPPTYEELSAEVAKKLRKEFPQPPKIKKQKAEMEQESEEEPEEESEEEVEEEPESEEEPE